jgi:hypothetical protein
MTQTRTLSSTDERRLFLGLLVQPPFAAALTYVAFPLIDATGRPLYGGSTPDTADAAIAVALGVGVVAAVITVLCVLPTVVWVMKRTTVTFGRAALFGAAFGNIPVVVASALAGNYGPAGAVRASVIGTVLGVSGATLFWVLVIRGRTLGHSEQAG